MIAEKFADFMEANGFGETDTNIFIGGVPEGAPTASYWIVTGGGSPVSRNKTNEMLKNYILQIYYRNNDGQDVYTKLHELELLVNSDECTQIEGFETIEIQATLFPTDQDLDVQDRTVGLLEVTVKVYA